jgi:tRNA nucleotidyltransferase (CCA-adding enzyme)
MPVNRLLHNNLIELFERLNVLNRAYYVGGMVRDHYLGRKSSDIDVCIECVTDSDIKLLTKEFGEQKGEDFPVFIAYVQGENGLEKVDIAVARTERKIGPKHTDFKVEFGLGITIKDDLLRRDITINAIAIKVSNLNVILDPCNGIADIRNGVLRHCSKAFGDDPLRVFRVAKFSARLGFRVWPETLNIMRDLKEETRSLSAERIEKELSDVFDKAKYPSYFFKVLRDSDNLEIWFNHLHKMVNLPHAYEDDVFNHTLEVIDIAKSVDHNNDVLYAALYHDTGKIFTDETSLPYHYGHDNVEKDIIDGILEQHRFSTSSERSIRDSIKYHVLLNKADKMRPSKLLRLVAILTKNGTLDNVISLVNIDRITKGFGKLDDDIISRINLAKYINSIKIPNDLIDTFAGKGGKVINKIVEQYRVNNFNLIENLNK